MKKYVVLSTDNTKEYFQLLPLVCYSWQKLGYIPVIIDVINVDRTQDTSEINIVYEYCPKAIITSIYNIKGVKDSTVAQISRLFAYCLPFISDEDIIVSGDADMVIAKDIFTHDGIVSYGHDLTGFSELPICYVKASKKQWKELISIDSEDDVFISTEIEKHLPKEAFSDKWEEYWSVDQQLLTKRASEYGFEKILFVNRGHDKSNHGLPKGRWDRYKWDNVPSEVIDVHIKRNDKEAQIKAFKTLFPNDNINWLLEFLKKI